MPSRGIHQSKSDPPPVYARPLSAACVCEALLSASRVARMHTRHHVADGVRAKPRRRIRAARAGAGNDVTDGGIRERRRRPAWAE